MIANTTSLTTEYTDAMSLVDHDRAIVLVLELYDLRKLSQVALHREYTINNDELNGIVRKILENTLEVFHIVVLIVKLCSKRETTTINDRCVVAVITDDIIVSSYNHCQHALVYRETGREAKSIVFANKFSEFFLELKV